MAHTSRTFRIFVSSTFSDLKAERNALQENVFPRLRDLAAAHGCRFQAIDLRWGVSEEAALDQQTMHICLGEIERCQKTSPRPNFIVLLGDRYGWRPLPSEIPAKECEKIRHAVSKTEKRLLEQWYRGDNNAIPPTYCLQPRRGEFAEYERWEKVEKNLRQVFLSAIKKLAFSPEAALKYSASATEQEIIAGALKIPDAGEHVFCFLRTIQRMPEDGSAALFQESDPEAAQKQRELKERLKNQLAGNIHEYTVGWQGQAPSLEHLDQLCEDVYSELSRVILAETGKLENVDPLEREIAAHEIFGKEHARIFFGRADLLKAIGEYLAGRGSHPLAVRGVSGSGKTALMAKAVEQAQKRGQNVLYRFVGATPESSNGRALLASLCQQISRCYGADESTIPLEYKDLVQEFPRRLALAQPNKPLILFLDALDQLSDTDNARDLSWLPVDLPPNARLVLAAQPGECLQALEGKLPEQNQIIIRPMTVKEGKIILDLWLTQAMRRVSEKQEKLILDRFKQCGLPLYLKLACEEAKLWKSYEQLPELSPDIPGILRDLYQRLSLESNHGPLLVSRSLGYLASAKNGLSENELLDLLSLDEDILADFQRRSPKSPKVDWLPVVVWSRFFFDLEPYLIERSADGTSLMAFYHRQFAEVVETEFLAGPDRIERHRKLAAYFSSQPLYHVSVEPEKPNLRKLSEQPYQQAWANLGRGFAGTLTDFAFLRAKLTAFGPQPLIEDYDLTGRLSIASEKERSLHLIQEALQLSAALLATDPERLPGQLTGRLVGHDNPEISGFLEDVLDRAPRPWLCPLTPALTQAGGPLERVLPVHTGSVNAVAVSADGARIISGGDDRAVRVWDLKSGRLERTLECRIKTVLEVHVTSDNRRMERTMDGPAGRVMALAITPDGTRIVSGGDDNAIRVWNLASGGLERTLECPFNTVRSLAVTPDGRGIISGGSDQTVSLWDLASGRLICKFEGHTGWVLAVAVTPDGRRVLSGGYDSTIRVWNLSSGQLEHTIQYPGGSVNALAVTPDGRGILSGSDDRTVRVWDLASGQLERVCDGTAGPVNSVVITPDGTRIVSDGDGDAIRVWDLASGRLERRLNCPAGGVKALAVSADGGRVISGGLHGVRVWNLAGENPERPIENSADMILALAVTPDGRWIASDSGNGRKVLVWELKNGNLKQRLEGHLAPIASLAVTPDGHQIVSGGADATLRVWDLASGRLERTLAGHTGGVSGVTVTPNGRWIVSGSQDRTIRIWNLASGRLECTLEGHTSGLSAIAVTPDGKWIISGSYDQTIRVWDLASGQLERTLEQQTSWIRAVTVTADSRRIISGSHDRLIRVWDLASGRLERTFESSGYVQSVAVTRDGLRIISCGDEKVHTWDLTNGQESISWVSDPGVRVLTCSTVPSEVSLIVYGDSAGGVHVLRLIEATM